MATKNSRERFREATRLLVAEKSRIKERLLVAYASQLSCIDPNRELPDTMVTDFDLLKYALSDAEKIPYGFGEFAAKKIHDMSEEDAAEMARKIFSMFLQLHDSETQKTVQ